MVALGGGDRQAHQQQTAQSAALRLARRQAQGAGEPAQESAATGHRAYPALYRRRMLPWNKKKIVIFNVDLLARGWILQNQNKWFFDFLLVILECIALVF